MQHLAIIMDGNRRWARAHQRETLFGHHSGAENLIPIVRAAAASGISWLTCFAFSSENWKRSEAEVSGLLALMRRFLMRETEKLVAENVVLSIIGDWTMFDADMQALFASVEEQTAKNDGLRLNLAINYGGKQDIIQAARQFRPVGPLSPSDQEALFKKHLQTAKLPPVDMVIRTGGERRLSNFLLWDMAYAEIYFSDKFWPEFSVEDLTEALDDFAMRQRRFGGDERAEPEMPASPMVKGRHGN